MAIIGTDKISLGLLYYNGKLDVTSEVRSLPLGKRRKPGRPKKLPMCLTRSPPPAVNPGQVLNLDDNHNETMDSDIEMDDDDEINMPTASLSRNPMAMSSPISSHSLSQIEIEARLRSIPFPFSSVEAAPSIAVSSSAESFSQLEDVDLNAIVASSLTASLPPVIESSVPISPKETLSPQIPPATRKSRAASLQQTQRNHTETASLSSVIESDTEYIKLTNILLREECKRRGLLVSGNKASMVVRLQNFDNGSEPTRNVRRRGRPQTKK